MLEAASGEGSKKAADQDWWKEVEDSSSFFFYNSLCRAKDTQLAKG